MVRFWKVAMILSVGGALPGTVLTDGCFFRYGEKVTGLNTVLSDPWAATANSTAAPTGFLSSTLNGWYNPGADPEWQRILNDGFAALQTFIQSNINVQTPRNWVDMGKPR